MFQKVLLNLPKNMVLLNKKNKSDILLVNISVLINTIIKNEKL